MALVRVCSVLLLVLCLDSVAGKPMFGFLCGWICDDYDDDISTTTAADDYDLCDCGPPRRRRITTTTRAPAIPMMPGQNPNAMNFIIRPDGGGSMTFTLLNNGASGWEMQMGPRPAPFAPGFGPMTTTSTFTTVASGTTAAGATTAAPSATTTAAGATTAGTPAAAGK